jgi:hypothetical protein
MQSQILNAQRAQESQSDLMLSQQQVYEAEYRANQSAVNASAGTGYGGYGGAISSYPGGSYGIGGIGGGFGIGGSIGIGL